MQLDWRMVGLVGGALFLASLGYNAWVGHLERWGHDRGYMGFIVAVGVGYTLLGAGLLVGWLTVLIVLGCFVASGTPMIVGSVLRYARKRAQEQEQIEEAARRVFLAVEGGDGDAA